MKSLKPDEPSPIKVRETEILKSDSRQEHRQKIARITLDAMVQFVGLLDAEGTVLEINKVALDAVGIKLSEVEGKPFWTTFWWQVSDEINATLRESIARAAQGEFVRCDTQIYGRAGGKETIIIDASLCPVKDDDGNVVFICAEGRDITQKKAQEREIAQKNAELQALLERIKELDKIKTQFFANVSHEFRTPLTLMLGPLEDSLGESQDPLSKHQRERQELIYRNSVRLLKLVNTLLDFSRIEAGKVKAIYRPTDLAKFTTDLTSVFRAAIEKAGLKLIVNAEPLGEPVYVDPEMWEKIVLNLLSNALKFTFAGEIEVSVRRTENNAEVKVRDTGTGIPQAQLSHVFERFHRVEGAKGRTHEGSGIGLALIQELARFHGGSISVTSEIDKGSTFTVSIPLGKDHLASESIREENLSALSTGISKGFQEEASRWLPEALPAAEAIPVEDSNNGSAIEPAISNKRILVADDNADLRRYLRNILGKSWRVDVVENGLEALTSALKNPPDLILSDVMMPGLDGFGLIKALKARDETKSIPVILLSARAGEESRVEGLESGADDYLVKPISAKELVARVQTHLDIGRLRNEAELEKAKLFSLFMQAPVAVCVLEGPSHIFSLVNPSCAALLSAQGWQLIGKPVVEALPELKAQEIEKLLDGAYQTGTPYFGKEERLPVNDENGGVKELFVDFIYHPKRDVDGTIDGILVVATDVTEKILARRKIEQAVSTRDEFLSVASHELKTPLTSLKLQIQMTLRSMNPEKDAFPSKEKVTQVLSSSNRQILRLQGLVEDLLDVAKIRAGKLTLNPENVHLASLVREVVGRFQEQINESQASVKLDLDEDIAGEWDSARIEQVVINLLSNALKYAPGKPIESRVERRGGACFSIKDQGHGIPKDKQLAIFERFERVTSSRDISGLGLGLFIVKQIVESHKGSVHVESEPGSGAKFIVQLPLKPLQIPNG